ncbi:MAG: KamA family radical SAM protein [Sphaerochaetaceae bacterium]|jgi:lysine 2,3-aminomutase
MITSLKELQQHLNLTEKELAWFEKKGSFLPFAVSPYYLSLIDPHDPLDPLRIQVIPSIDEQHIQDFDQTDPLAEENHEVYPRLIHRYANRVAFLVTDVCATYCRHCFRRRFTATEHSKATKEEIEQVASYVKEHPQVIEMLLTGGDPLMLSDSYLDTLIGTIRAQRSELVLRLCTRMPAVYPERVTAELIQMLKKHTTTAMYVMTQFNHPRELTEASMQATNMFVDAGFPLLNQTVLLKGVNDNPDTLEALMNGLVAHRIKPYYLFQGDLVGGTSHLRVPLATGFALEKELRRRLSGLAMPQYAVDLPFGGGKVPLSSSYVKGQNEDGQWVFKTLEGQKRIYADPQ